MDRIWIQDANGYQTIEPRLPNCWQGEADCVVGPFSSQDVARQFIRTVVVLDQYDMVMDNVFAKGDAWYVEVTSLTLRA